MNTLSLAEWGQSFSAPEQQTRIAAEARLLLSNATLTRVLDMTEYQIVDKWSRSELGDTATHARLRAEFEAIKHIRMNLRALASPPGLGDRR